MSDYAQNTRDAAEHSGKPKKKLGVIGGMGPAATAYFYELLTKMAKVDTDQEHIEALIISRPSIPDRTAYILGKSQKCPIAPIIETGNALVAMGADYIAIPCVTSHCFYDELSVGIKAPIIHMVRETAEHLKKANVPSAGLMATDGAISSGLFQNELEAHNIRSIAPSPQMQALVMDLIYNSVKANKPIDIDRFMTITDELKQNGAEIIILACTELSLAKREYSLSGGYADVLEVLALRSLESCGVRTVL